MRGVTANSDAIRRARCQAGWTQEQLANVTDCDVKTIRKAETSNKRVDLKVIVGIANALSLEPHVLIVQKEETPSSAQSLLERVKQWSEAFLHADIERLLSLHTANSILELPGTEDLPEAGYHEGIEALQQHFVKMFSLFRLRHIDPASVQYHHSGNFVFMRSTAEFEYLPAGKTYRARHFNEFEFEGDLISRHVSTADYGELRKIIAAGEQ